MGPREAKKFRMIERHYFRDQLVKSFDFSFGFCIPSSTNTWDVVYAMPPLSDELIADMINHPWDTKSDTFYFVEDRIIMHNKASYSYFREDVAQAKKSYEGKFASKSVKAGSGAADKEGAKAPGGGGTRAGGEEDKVAEAKVSTGGRAGLSPAKGVKQEWSKEADYDD